MADVIRKATNRFTKGLVMDFSPENTKNELLTHALNATLLTFNGNELSLQNDMGNGRVETAYLPDGYMPVGTCEYGGIVYIVSYNPLENKSLIGCFPSPERNISSDELGKPDVKIPRDNFQEFVKDASGKYFPNSNGKILHNSYYALLKNDNLNPGDKFIVCAGHNIYDEKLADLWVDKDPQHYSGKPEEDPKGYELVDNPVIALNIVSIEDSGKIVYLNSEVRHYEELNTFTKEGVTFNDTYKYHILGKMIPGANQLAQSDLDNYRNVLSSGYSVFKSKTSGKLAILAELIMIDSYSVTHSLQPKRDEIGDIIEGAFDIVIHTDVSPKINKNNYNTVPKLKYYYLENSLGYILVDSDYVKESQIPLFVKLDTTKADSPMIYNGDFFRTELNKVYTAIDNKLTDLLEKTLQNSGKFNFPIQNTYHGQMKLLDDEATGGSVDEASYTKFTEGKFHRVAYSQVKDNAKYYYDTVLAKFYYYNAEGIVNEEFTEKTIDTSYTYYTRKESYIYHDVERNTKYQTGYDLYKLYSEPITATETEIYDETIEKFQYQEVHTYKEATEADKTSGEKLYYKDDDNKYVQLTGSPDDTTIYYILVVDTNLVSIGFEVNQDTAKGSIYYYPGTKSYVLADLDEIDMYYDFTRFPHEPNPPYGAPLTLYWQEPKYIFVEATEHELNKYIEGNTKLYYSTNYVQLNRLAFDLFSGTDLLFIVVPVDIYVDESKFVPNIYDNYINGLAKPAGNYPKDDPLFVYTLENFIPKDEPENSDLILEDKGEYYSYKDLKLANITLPSVVTTNGLDLPFKYDYTLVPCMNYGKLQHLAVSNTIDFSKLHAFNQSRFHTWKYRIDNNQLRLTFGCDVYDTYETSKVDAIILEFYDIWGFAGSLEIVDKKSYSGVFTKIIPLNSLKALSRKKISGNAITERYKRNINLKEDGTIEGVGGPFIYNADDADAGWNIPDEHPKTKEELNDCGTLYTNVVYGVKAYFRRTNKETNTHEYIKKKDFFLYTLPIYNDFYYTTQDFSNITYPELEFVLTYKLKDTSTKNAYGENDIVGGYNQTDKDNIKDYLGGFCEAKSLDLIKYYKYTGTTDLYVEIGLKKEYELLNLSYDKSINSRYSCSLQLFSDDDDKNTTFTINSGIDGLVGANQILNYAGLIPENVNKLGFGESYATTQPLSGITGANFITNNGENPIKIKYEFVVGYTASIANIRDTQVLATTVCALFHKNPEGEYNYEDFGIYELEDGKDSDGNPITKLLSNVMFYNEGTSTKEVFGICQQMTTSGTIINLCHITAPMETDAQEIKILGKLNTGEPLRQLIGKIGKLTFCQPHAHGLSEENGVNIYNLGLYKGIGPYYGGWKIRNEGSTHDDEWDDTYGIIPREDMKNNPLFNLSINTKNMINYQSEFISAIHYNTMTGNTWGYESEENYGPALEGNCSTTMRVFTGFTGDEVATFNKKLIETMKSVYAYNPDYDSLTVNVGNISLQEHNPSFTSNIVNTSSKLNYLPNETLNNYIYIGPIIYQDYLDKLTEHSKSKLNEGYDLIATKQGDEVLPLLEFKENFDYCGTEENKYLLSSLTYNTPVPSEIESELEFSASNITVIKHSDGSNTFMQGTPNKKTLYGYHAEYDKMIQLDVSNYTILNDGTLVLSEESTNMYPNQEQTFDSDAIKLIYQGTYIFNKTIENTDGTTSNVRLGFYLNRESAGAFSSQTALGENGFFVSSQSSYRKYDPKFTLRPEIYVISSDGNHKYSVKVDSITFSYSYAALNDQVGVWDGDILLSQQSYENLHKLTDMYGGSVNLVDRYGVNTGDKQVYEYWISTDVSSGPTFNGSWLGSDFDNTVTVNTYGLIDVDFSNSFMGLIESNYMVGLLELRLTSVKFTVTLSSKLSVLPESFVKTTTTNKYSRTNNNVYTVDSIYNNARFRGSSITINDLVYEPNQLGHRLFMKPNLYHYDNSPRAKIYYRALAKELASTWIKDNTLYLNSLFLYTGPCFTTDNLN